MRRDAEQSAIVAPSIAELFLDPPYHFTGSPVQLVATVIDREGQAREAPHCAVTWSSADPGLAGVTAAGVAWPRGSGSTEIHAVVRRPCFDVMACWHLEDTVSVTVNGINDAPTTSAGSGDISIFTESTGTDPITTHGDLAASAEGVGEGRDDDRDLRFT